MCPGKGGLWPQDVTFGLQGLGEPALQAHQEMMSVVNLMYPAALLSLQGEHCSLAAFPFQLWNRCRIIVLYFQGKKKIPNKPLKPQVLHVELHLDGTRAKLWVTRTVDEARAK